MVLINASCSVSRTSIHSSSGTLLPDLIPWIYLSLPLYNRKGFDLGHTWMATELNWMASDFPYFLQFKSEFCNKELMIWATASSWSCFYWLYRASSSSVAKNIINLILAWTIWWCPSVELSLVLLEEGICYNQCVPLTTLSAFALFHFVLQGQTCLLLQLSLEFQLLPFNPLWKKGHFLLVLVLEGLIGLHRTDELQLLQH